MGGDIGGDKELECVLLSRSGRQAHIIAHEYDGLRRSSYFLSFRSRNIVSSDDYNATTTEQKTKRKSVYCF